MRKEPTVVNCHGNHRQITTNAILIQIQTELTLSLSLIHYQIFLKISTKIIQSLISYHSAIVFLFFIILVLG